jgi:hypothetical protein
MFLGKGSSKTAFFNLFCKPWYFFGFWPPTSELRGGANEPRRGTLGVPLDAAHDQDLTATTAGLVSCLYQQLP